MDCTPVRWRNIANGAENVRRQRTNQSVAPLRNVAAVVALVDRLHNRSPNLPGIGVFYGPSGFGKTTAGIFATNKFNAVTVQVKSAWTRKKLCEAILAEMCRKPASTIGDMLDQISEHLAVSDRPLIIDEADFLVDRKMIEIVYDMYEGSQAPLVLIGEEMLPQKLRQWERVHGRILDWVPAEEANAADLKQLAKIYCAGVEIDEALRVQLLRASSGSIRRISVNLDLLREHAQRLGRREIGVQDWKGREFFTGTAPQVRRFGDTQIRSVG